MPRIFISYRRNPDTDIAGRLYDGLVTEFGAENVFRDDESIPKGVDWEKDILDNIQECDVFLALLSDETFGRIHNDGDWVRREIALALTLPYIRIIPVLINGFQIPNPEDLPEDIRELTRLQAAVLLSNPFNETLRSLIREIKNITPHEIRGNKLLALYKLSRARCIERWQALGLTEKESIDLSDDFSIGVIKPEFRTTPNRKLLLLVAEMGTGKSLIAERLFQEAIEKAQKSPKSPIPIFLDSKYLGTLTQSIENACTDLGDLYECGLNVIIDGADETGLERLEEILRESRRLVHMWDKATVTITTRPNPLVSDQPEKVEIPTLSWDETQALITRITRPNFPIEVMWSDWPSSIKDAALRPLFAILVGVYLRENNGVPVSKGNLLSSLAKRSLLRAGLSDTNYHMLLERIAALTFLWKQNFIPRAEIGIDNEIDLLLKTRLIVERDGNLGFPLPILSEWFAAHSLINGSPPMDEIMGNSLNNWRYPLMIAISYFNHDKISKLLTPLIQGNPAFASQIVYEAISPSGYGRETILPPANECKLRILTTMQAWVQAIGQPLSDLIAPVDVDGHLLPLAVGVDGSHLTTVWGHLSDQNDNKKGHMSPIRKQYFRGSYPAPQSAWAWRWTLDELVSSLTRQFNLGDAFPITDGPLFQELVWRFVLALCNGTYYTNSFSLDVIKNNLEEIKKQLLITNTVSIVARTSGHYEFNQQVVEVLEREIAIRQYEGKAEYTAPWPGSDRGLADAHWIWDMFSTERSLKRTQTVYEGGLEGYKYLVTKWFSRFAYRMPTFVMLPACLKGVLVPAKADFPPSLSWYLQPLPIGSENLVDIKLGEEHIKFYSDEFQSSVEQLKRLRPKESEWTTTTLRTQVLDDIFDVHPIRSLVYALVKEDLSHVCWLES